MDWYYKISMSNNDKSLSQQLEEYLLYPHTSELVLDKDLTCSENIDNAEISSSHSSFEWIGGRKRPRGTAEEKEKCEIQRGSMSDTGSDSEWCNEPGRRRRYNKRRHISELAGTSMDGQCDDSQVAAFIDSLSETISREAQFSGETNNVPINPCHEGVHEVITPEMQKQKEYIDENIVVGFRERAPRRRILHDIFKRSITGDSDRDVERVVQQHFAGTIFIVAKHGDHYHVVHDCTYHSYQCRCARICNWPTERCNRKIVYARAYTSEHWRNTTAYLYKGERSIIYCEIAGRTCVRGGETRYLPLQTHSQQGEEGLLEGSQNSSTIQCLFDCGSSTQKTGGDNTDSSSKNQRNRENNRRKGDKILNWLKMHLSAPLSLIFNTTIYHQSEFVYTYNKNHQLLQTVSNILATQIMDMSFNELYDFHNEAEICIFNAPNGNISEYYYDVNQSLEILDALIKFQHPKDYIGFLTNVYQVFDKTLPKKNTLQLISEPSAGKTYFIDAILSYSLCFGSIGNFNRYCNFPLQEAVSKRTLVWNEPNVEPAAYDTIKMILGGDNCPARIKHQPDGLVVRTPIFITTNNIIFPNNAAFNDRILTYTWKPCPHLKKFKLKPHPHAIYLLMLKYNINKLSELPLIESTVINDSGEEDEYYDPNEIL